jgi:Skp family chaperone for outer membrane proteins
MNTLMKPVAAVGLALAAMTSPLAIAPAAAQAVKGIGVVNIQGVAVSSNAFKTAAQQRPVTYKAQIDQANARRAAITAQLQPMYTKLQTDSQAPNANQQALQTQAAQLQQLQQVGQQELQGILAPVMLSEAYVEEQIQDKLNTAIQNAAKKQNITLVLSPENVLYAEPAYNLNQQVLAELNTLLPSAQLVPPAGWLPREAREQQAQQQAAQAPGAAPAATPVQGR